jgi:hypothetical protein
MVMEGYSPIGVGKHLYSIWENAAGMARSMNSERSESVERGIRYYY